ncbi:hypothetical protein QBC46DRAFT_378751 [Diplogelasinospora grovesii]|uniref:Uncharacterized protein n=1 Tax=Diplogelasinospora grovesii TaxID=303347 RepID=A0AAN6NF41_9PEZI|nr:hypothetical protein QBC46DRAFT_378751 [Diplogelasinospora grovesii]
MFVLYHNASILYIYLSACPHLVYAYAHVYCKYINVFVTSYMQLQHIQGPRPLSLVVSQSATMLECIMLGRKEPGDRGRCISVFLTAIIVRAMGTHRTHHDAIWGLVFSAF